MSLLPPLGWQHRTDERMDENIALQKDGRGCVKLIKKLTKKIGLNFYLKGTNLYCNRDPGPVRFQKDVRQHTKKPNLFHLWLKL